MEVKVRLRGEIDFTLLDDRSATRADIFVDVDGVRVEIVSKTFPGFCTKSHYEACHWIASTIATMLTPPPSMDK